MKIKNKNYSEIFEKLGLDERAIYLVEVKCSPSNSRHKSILFTGFKNGSYCEVYNNTYDAPIPLNKLHSIKIVKKVCDK